MRRSTVDRLSSATTAAVGQLLATINNAGVPIAVRVRASLGVLGEARQWIEVHDLTQRIEALEEAIATPGLDGPITDPHEALAAALAELDRTSQ